MLVMAQPKGERYDHRHVVKQIRRATRRRFTAEEKIHIVLEGLQRRDSPVTELCRTRRDSTFDLLQVVQGLPGFGQKLV